MPEREGSARRVGPVQGEAGRHEEKETDVAIAVTLIELFLRDECDAAVLVTGESDIAPALRLAQRQFPGKAICC